MNRNAIETDTRAFFERFPHLRDRIELLWGTPQGAKAISTLVFDSREGHRAGFPPEHAATVMALYEEHSRKFPEFSEQVEGFETDKDTVGRRARLTF